MAKGPGFFVLFFIRWTLFHSLTIFHESWYFLLYFHFFYIKCMKNCSFDHFASHYGIFLKVNLPNFGIFEIIVQLTLKWHTGFNI